MKKTIMSVLICVVVVVALALTVTACSSDAASSSNSNHVHEYGEWTITRQPTCSTPGEKTRDCSCGDIQTQQIPTIAHQYGEWVTTKPATCTTTGTKTATCSVCGDTKTQAIATVEHQYGEWVTTTPATCTEDGTKKSTCAICGESKTQTIAATGHNFGAWSTKTQPTCTAKGVKERTCKTCGQKESADIDALGHDIGGSGKCTRCGITPLSMTETEENNAKLVTNMSHSVSEYSDKIRISISFKDGSGYTKQAPCYVDIKIKDKQGKVLYDGTVVKTTSDSYVSVDYSELAETDTSKGTLYYTVYNDYFSFEEVSKTLEKLPWMMKLTLPILPKSISCSSYSHLVSCNVTSITIKKASIGFQIFVSGEKTYDSKGNSYSSMCEIGYKLYDEDGYVVKSGTIYTSQLAVGEKFKNEYFYATDIEEGKTYRLELLNIG